MVSDIVKRILIGVIATVLFCVSLAIFAYTPVSSREPNSSYTSLSQLLIIYAIFSGPVFIIAGVFWSFAIDKINVKHQQESKSKRYLRKFIWYIFAGIVSTLIFLLILSNGAIVYNSETLSFLVVGIIGSLLYYHLLIIRHFLFDQRRGDIGE